MWWGLGLAEVLSQSYGRAKSSGKGLGWGELDAGGTEACCFTSALLFLPMAKADRFCSSTSWSTLCLCHLRGQTPSKLTLELAGLVELPR